MPRLFTRTDYDRLPEGFPAQLVEGCLVKEPAPTYGHQSVQSLLHAALAEVVDPRLALTAPADVVLGDHDVYQPDVVVLRRRPPSESRDVGIPLVAFEILSPSTAERDRTVKKDRLLAAGTAEVWLLDLEQESIEVHTPTTVRTAHGDASIRSEALADFVTSAAALFA